MRYFFGKPKQVITVDWGDGEIKLSLPTRSGRMTATFPLTAPLKSKVLKLAEGCKIWQRGVLYRLHCVSFCRLKFAPSN